MGLVVKKKQGHTCDLSLSDTFFEYFSLEKAAEEGAVFATADAGVLAERISQENAKEEAFLATSPSHEPDKKDSPAL